VIKHILKSRLLTLRLSAAIRVLACRPRRSRGWFGERSNGFDRELRVALARENVPGDSVHGAMRALNSDSGRLASSGVCEACGLHHSARAEAAARASFSVKVAAMYDNVEAIVYAVHGSSAAAAEELAEFKSLRDEECSRDSVDEDPPPARRSMWNNLSNLRQNCLAPYIR